MMARLRELLRVLFPSPNKFAPDPPPKRMFGRPLDPVKALREDAERYDNEAKDLVISAGGWRKRAEEEEDRAHQLSLAAAKCRNAADALDPAIIGRHNQRSHNMM